MWWWYFQTTPRRWCILGTRETRCLPRSTRWRSGAGGDLPPSTICPRQGQCGVQFSFSSQSGSGDGLNSTSGDLRLAPQTLACYDRSLLRHLSITAVVFILRQSWILWLRGQIPCFSLEQSTGLCFFSIRHASSSSEAKELQGGCRNLDSSILASERVVPGPSGTTLGAPSSSAGEVGSSQATAHLSFPSEAGCASSSCVETIRRLA